MKVEDWSTGKLMRRMFKYYRKTWNDQRYDPNSRINRRLLYLVRDELNRRGWTV